MFGVVFPGLSFAMDMSNLTQIDPLHWHLDMSNLIAGGQSYHEYKQICIFLFNSSSLPPGKALAVYIQPPGHPSFLFCGAIHLSCPSALLPLPWPHPANPLAEPPLPPAKIGISVKDLDALPTVATDGGLTLLETYPSWLHIPTPLVEHILERLPLLDYVRFAAVCRQWRSVQREHRLRYAPNLPPMLPVPWLIVPAVQKGSTILCYSPFEKRSYRLPLPSSRYKHINVFPNGWLLLRDVSRGENGYLSLWNPISRVHIQLPPLRSYWHFHAAMSTSDPNWTILMADRGYLYLFRRDDPDWTKLSLPLFPESRGIKEIVFIKGKFYCLLCEGGLIIVDPAHEPTTQLVEMDMRRIDAWSLRQGLFQLVVSDGDLLLVVIIDETYECFHIEDLRVFKADLLRKMWVNVRRIGDRMLMIHSSSHISLLAATVGGRRNSIYFPSTMIAQTKWRIPISWIIFDLRTERFVRVLRNTKPKYNLSQLQKHSMYWTMPSIC